jgi:hypothetical protein
MIDWSILVPYVVGTFMGLYFGYKRGVRLGADLTISRLCIKGYVKFRTDGESFELFKLNEEVPDENQE